MIRIKPVVRLKKAKHSKNAQEILKRIEDYLSGNEGEPIRLLCNFWKDQQTAITYAELRQIVEQGYVDIDTLKDWQQDYSKFVENKFSGVWEKALEAGSISQPILDGKGFRFNSMAPGATQWLEAHGAEFVTNCTSQQQKAISALVQLNMLEKHTVEELARTIRPCIGLTKGQSESVLKYYDTIKENLRQNHPKMRQDSIEAKALKAAQRYAEKEHRARAQTIAQTEIAKAYNHGTHEGMRQAQQAGLLGPLKKVWSTSGNENTCPLCEEMDGKTVGFDEGFGWSKYLFNDSDMLPPAHPRCACAIEYVETEPPNGGYTYNPDYFESIETDDDISGTRKNYREAYDAMPDVMKESLRNTVVRYANDPTSHYDPNSNTITLTPKSKAEASYHEIGHVFAEKLVDKKEADRLLNDIIDELPVSAFLAKPEAYKKDDGTVVYIDIIKSKRFVSEYQGRFYGKPKEYFDENGSFKSEEMLEFISEPFREFWTNRDRLYDEFREFYDLIAKGLKL